MTEDQFLTTNSAKWHELGDYCQRINKNGIKSLETHDIKKFLNLFKLTSHHLAYAKTHYTGSRTIIYLNNLISQCNTYVYTIPKTNVTSVFSSIFTSYSMLLKKYRTYILFSFAIFMIGAFFSFLLVYFKPENAALFLDSSLIEMVVETGDGADNSNWNYPLMSSYIMMNNILVSLKAFAFGIIVGVGTGYILFFNGLTLGSLSALFYLYGDPVKYWACILPHGVAELTAIFIAGAAGLLVGKSLLIPGRLSRKHSLIKGTKEAVQLLSGVIVLLIVAGLIEGFISPLHISITIKYTVALLSALLITCTIG